MAEQTSENGRPPIAKVVFQTNILEKVALAFDGEGLTVKSTKVGYGDQVLFSLVDGRRMYVAPFAADQIKRLGIRRDEEFMIGKVEVRDGQKRKVNWKVEKLQPETPLARDIRNSLPIAQAQKAGDPRSSIEIARSMKEPSAPPPMEWTGIVSEEASRQPARSNKPAAASASTNGSMSPAVSNGHTSNPPTKLPYDVAFREILSWMKSGLDDAHEQWNDESKQGLVSTVLIQMAKDGWLRLWERP